MLSVSHGMSNRLQRRSHVRIHLDVSEHGEIIASVNAVEMSLQISREILPAARRLGQFGGILFIGKQLDAAIFENRRLARQGTRLFVSAVKLRVTILLASTSG